MIGFGQCVAIVCWLLAVSSASADDTAAKFASLKPGMTAAEVAKQLSQRKPEKIARQIIYRRHLEQWFFEKGAVRLEFDIRPNEEPRLLRVVQTGGASP